MAFLEMREFVADDSVHFPLSKFVYEVLSEDEVVGGVGEGVGLASFACGNNVNLTKTDFCFGSEGESSIAKFTGSNGAGDEFPLGSNEIGRGDPDCRSSDVAKNEALARVFYFHVMNSRNDEKNRDERTGQAKGG